MKIKETTTEKNLKLAFAGESQASIKYKYYAQRAREEGYENIALIFEETSKNEFEHAKIWYKYLNEGDTPTLKNLNDAAFGENYEWTDMYEEFARVARSEGLEQIAKSFEGVGKIENHHEQTFKALISDIEDSMVFSKPTEVIWKCMNCGHIHVSNEAPKVCEVCNHPQSFFKVACEE